MHIGEDEKLAGFMKLQRAVRRFKLAAEDAKPGIFRMSADWQADKDAAAQKAKDDLEAERASWMALTGQRYEEHQDEEE